jgi:hypothetical protein
MEPTTTNRKSRQRSSCGLSHAQMTAAKIAELEFAREAGTLTTLRHLCSQLTTAPSIEKATCSTFAPTATSQKQRKTLPKSHARLKPKHLWPDLRALASHSTSNASGQLCQLESPGLTSKDGTELLGSSLLNRMMMVTEIEFP